MGLATFLLLFLLCGTAAACPSCKETVSSQGETLTRAWASSIYLLMGTPYLLFAGLTLYVVRAARRTRKK